MKHTIRSTRLDFGGFDATGTYQPRMPEPKFETTVRVKGSENPFAGYGIGQVPAGSMGRQENGGPLVPGPFAYMFGLASVIASNPEFSTGGVQKKQAAAGLLIDAEAGDTLVLDGEEYVLVVSKRGYPNLVHSSKARPDEVEQVAAMSLYRSWHGVKEA